MKKLLIFLVINTCLYHSAIAQNEFNNWFFGKNSSLNFGTGAPVFVTGSNLVSQEGCSSISDRNGNLLFYTNGVTVWNRNHLAMPNGTGLLGDVQSTLSALITKHPGNDSIYYLFTTAKDGGNTGLRLTIVNMKMDGGLGDVDITQKNIDFFLPVCEKIIAVKHRNLNDTWIIARRFGFNDFVRYRINCTGLIAFPTFISIGPRVNTPGNAGGYLKASPDGKKIAMANFEGNLELFNFDDVTGNISNWQTIPANSGYTCGPYGVEFSPDSKLLYLSQAFTCTAPNAYEISQYDLNASDITASKVILDMGTGNVAGALQLGPDNKVYIAYDQAGYLGAIINPDVYGTGAGLVKPFVNLPSPALSTMGLPNISTAFVGYKRSLLGKDTTLCDADSLIIKLNLPNTTFEWSNTTTIDSIIIKAGGQYWVKITNGSCTYSDTINVIMQPSPRFNLGNDTSICQDKFPYVLKTSIPGATFVWQDGSTASTFSVKDAGLYWLQATTNTCSGRDSINIMASPITQFSLGADTSICNNAQIMLTANISSASYLWNTGATTMSITTDTAGVYWCEAINTNGCSYRDSIRILVKAVPQVNIGKDTAVCANRFPYRLAQSITGASFLWQDGSTDSSFSAPGNGLYWMQATLNGCSTRDTVQLNALAVDSFFLGQDTLICGRGAITLTASAASARYLWNTGSTAKSITVTATGLYWCEAIHASGCSYRDSIQISFNSAPPVNLGKDTALCQDKFPLRLAPSIIGATYLWQDGSTDSSFVIQGPGLYWLHATVNGCTTRDSVSVSAKPVDTFTLGADSTICGSQAITLAIMPDFTRYLWNTGSTSKSISVTSTGLYWGEATNSSGCSFRDTINLAFNPSAIVNLGSDTAFCQDNLPVLIGQRISGATYLWQDGSTNATYPVTTGGIYWVRATLNGCSTIDTVAIVVGGATSFSLGSDTSGCVNQSISLGQNQTFSKYLWSTGSTAPRITVNNSGIFWLEASNNFGCRYRDTIRVTLLSVPIINLGNDTMMCRGKFPLVLGQTISGATYLWQDGSTNAFYPAAQPGVYWVQATLNGCSARDSVTITVSDPSAFSLGNDRVVCNGQPLVLGVTGLYTKYLWSTGSTSSTITVSNTGVFWLEAADNTGCSYRDSISVAFRSPPAFSLGPDTIICNNPAYLLDVSNTGDNYSWQDNATQPQYRVNRTGSYYVSVTRGGCTATDTVAIVFKTSPAPDLGPDGSICPGEELIIRHSVTGVRSTWQDGTTDPAFKVTSPGRYSVKVENECGTGSDEVIIAVGSCNLLIPNAFTPGKSVNNIFRLVNAFGLKDYSLQVFNRWGQQVYHSTRSEEGWNGRYNGLEQPQGSYVYIISYTDPGAGKVLKKGTVTLIR